MIWNKKSDDEESLPNLPPQNRQIKSNSSPQIVESSNPEEEHFESIKTADKQTLPAFPDSPMDKGFSQSAIKEAVSDSEEKIPLPPKDDSKEDEEIDAFGSQPFQNDQKEKSAFIQPNPFLNSSVEFEQSTEPQTISKMKLENKPIKTISIPHDYPEDAPHPPIGGVKPQQPKPSRIPKIIQEPPKVEHLEEVEKPQKVEEKTTDVFVKIDKFYSAKKALSAMKQEVKEIEGILSKIRETKMKEEREISTWEKNISSLKEEISKVNENLFDKVI